MATISIIMGSQSDLPALKPAFTRLTQLGIEWEVRVLSAHRTPDAAATYAKEAAARGIQVIIAAAGKAAHLPGVLAAYTLLPVIGIPIAASQLDGMDALLSIVQMPAGIPVATVGIGAAENAALLAAQMLAMSDDALRQRLVALREEMRHAVELADAQVQSGVN